MNRREFLVGLVGTAAVASIPATVLDVVATDEWQAAIRAVYTRYFTEFVVFGSAAISSSPEFPFIRVVPYDEWINIPELYRSSGEY